MIIKLSGVEIYNSNPIIPNKNLQSNQPTNQPAHLPHSKHQPLKAFHTIAPLPLLLNAHTTDIATKITTIGPTLIDLFQKTLIGVSGVVVVLAGIYIAVGLKREGWRRTLSVIQGLGVGLIGPTAVMLIATLFSSFAKMIQ